MDLLPARRFLGPSLATAAAAPPAARTGQDTTSPGPSGRSRIGLPVQAVDDASPSAGTTVTAALTAAP